MGDIIMAHAPWKLTVNSESGALIGMFHEKEFNNFFEYSHNDDQHLSEDYPHKVWVTNPVINFDHGYRYAKVLKTVMYVVTDEDDYGKPVVEKWSIKGRKVYPKGISR